MHCGEFVRKQAICGFWEIIRQKNNRLKKRTGEDNDRNQRVYPVS